jgi:thiopurine S-methyltransferase
MTGRDNELWQQCWRDRETDGFHQKLVNPLLVRFWPSIGLAPGSRVFVPLCGKSLDMVWLLAQGYEVIGVELSPLAVRAFFKENRLQPERTRLGNLMRWRQGKLSIYCGDYFSLTQEHLGQIDAVYDRAALTALPEDIRVPYVAHLRSLLPDSCEAMLLTVEDAEEGETLADSLTAADEITALYASAFRVELAHVESMLEVDPGAPDGDPVRSEHKVYRLSVGP